MCYFCASLRRWLIEMKIFHHIHNISIKRPVATIGIFDGVHLAHQSVIRKLIEISRQLSGESVIITMWPHPRIVLNHQKDAIKLLNTLDEKIDRLENTGVENLIVVPFDRQFAALDFDVFIRDILVKNIGIHHLVVGYNHQFGRDRQGNYEKLKAMSEELNFGLSMQEQVLINNARVSSSVIRRLIMEGNIETANEYLGYRYFFSGKVVKGRGLGQKMGFPTANLQSVDPDKLLPGEGVYAVIVSIGGNYYKGMMNIGRRPTLNDKPLDITCEVNLFDFDGDLYNAGLKTFFIQRVRDEKKFNSADELKKQISNDKLLINKILASIKMEA